MTDVLLRTKKLRVGFERRAILPPLDLEIRRRELWGVIGRNGAGKTTLFRTLLGLFPAVSGQIDRPAGVRVGYVPQRNALDPLVPARAKDLIVEGSDHGLSFLRPLRTAEAKSRVTRAIEATGSGPLLSRRYRDLSEGEKQRVLLARALAGAPDLLVLDEPTSAMDLVAEREVTTLLARLRDEFGIGVLLVTHHLGLVATIADRLLFLDADDHVAVAGSVDHVMGHRIFEQRYGAVLGETRRPMSSRPEPRGAEAD